MYVTKNEEKKFLRARKDKRTGNWECLKKAVSEEAERSTSLERRESTASVAAQCNNNCKDSYVVVYEFIINSELIEKRLRR